MKNVTRSVKLSFDEKTYNIICKQAKLDGNQDAVKAMHECDGKTVSREEIMKELGCN